jgi:hypothetical protein
MEKIKECKLCDKKNFDNLRQLYSKPYSDEMLELSFKVINSNVFDELDKQSFLDEDKDSAETYFDDKKSVLYIKGQGIYINRQDKTTNAHKILKYIFIDNKNNLTDEFFYSEIAEDEFEDIEYKQTNRGWEKYRIACRDIQNKVKNQTNNQIKDFLIFNTGRKGRVKINPKYL